MKAAQVRELLASPELLDVARDDLRVAEQLRQRWPAALVAAATEQTVLRERAAAKFSRAESMLFTRPGLEQATSEVVAQHRARRYAAAVGDITDAPVLDLCCGVGGDMLAIGGVVPRVVGVDLDEVHALIARHNAAVHGVAATTVVEDVTDVRPDRASAVFIDPARRSPRGAADRRGGSSPPLDWCLSIDNPRTTVKTAPGIEPSVVPAGWEVEFVAVGRDLREAVLWSPAWDGPPRRATVLSEDGSAVELVPDPEAPSAPVRAPGRYLLDPSPAVTRAGGVADLAATLEAWQVDQHIAFLSADRPMVTPFGRCLEVQASLPFSVKAIATELRRLEITALDLRRRGLAGDVEDLRRRLLAKSGRGTGGRSATVVLTRVVNKPWAFVCTDVDRS